MEEGDDIQATQRQEQEGCQQKKKKKQKDKKNVHSSQAELTELQRKIAEREAHLARLEAKVQRMEEAGLAEEKEEVHTARAGAKVKLDVGGVHFTTTTTTLRSRPDSMLAAMFSGRHELEQDEDGRVFIDRDGKLFEHVLQYLRDGDLADVETLDRGLRERLEREAAYYCLPELGERLAAIKREDADDGARSASIYLTVKIWEHTLRPPQKASAWYDVTGDDSSLALPMPAFENCTIKQHGSPCQQWKRGGLSRDSWFYERVVPIICKGYSNYKLVSIDRVAEGYYRLHFNRWK